MICVLYGTVYNSVGTLEETLKTAWRAEYETIAVTDSGSKDGTWERLLELRKDYNLSLIRKKCTRGAGKNLALKKCPEGSRTAYIDFDASYVPLFHELIHSTTGYYSVKANWKMGTQATLYADRDDLLAAGGWRNLNSAEDIELRRRLKLEMHYDTIGYNKSYKWLGPKWRDRRYASSNIGFKWRRLSLFVDDVRGYGYSYRRDRDKLPRFPIGELIFLVAWVRGIYRYD